MITLRHTLAALALAVVLAPGAVPARSLPDFADLSDRVAPAVVNIGTTAVASYPVGVPWNWMKLASNARVRSWSGMD